MFSTAILVLSAILAGAAAAAAPNCPNHAATAPENAPIEEEENEESHPTSMPAGQPGDVAPPAHVRAAMNELWRRGSCLLEAVYGPAERESAVPKDIGDVPVVSPRPISRRGALLCYAVAGGTIWAADDLSLYQIDAASATPRRFGRAQGLPDEPIQAIAPAGNDVWLATRGGLARLDVKAGKIETLVAAAPAAAAARPDIRFNLAAMTVGGGRVWLLSDTGAWSVPVGQTKWARLPDFPMSPRLAQTAARGFWSELWPQRLRVLIPSLFATDDGLYVICMNQFLRFDSRANKWIIICDQAWQALPQGRWVWVMATGGVARYDAPTGTIQPFASGKGPASGRPVAMATSTDGFFLLSQPDYDGSSNMFVGGGVSRFDLATRAWTIRQQVEGCSVRFATAVLTEGNEAWIACKLYDRVIQSGAHPGMAHIKRWVPHASGMGLLHYVGGRWELIKKDNLKTETRWVLGQKGTLSQDHVGPDTVSQLRRCGSSIWSVYRMVPEHWYAGYYASVGCLATQADGGWRGRFDHHTADAGLAGEQPDLLLLSASHGPQFVLGEGQPDVLGIEDVGGNLAAVCQSGVYVADPVSGKFRPLLKEAFRAYWTVTCAAAGRNKVYFGGDGGTLSELDRRSGAVTLRAVCVGQKVTGTQIENDGSLALALADSEAVLPVDLPAQAAEASASITRSRLPLLVLPVDEAPAARAAAAAGAAYTCKGNYLLKGNAAVAFLRGVFRPRVLCEDPIGAQVWLATYDGLASVPIPAQPASQPHE